MTPQAAGGTVLVVDDEPAVRRALRRILLADGHTVIEAASGVEALQALDSAHPDVVILDLGLPDGNGLDVLTRIRAGNSTAGVVVLTGSNTNADMREALRRGASSYLHKPADALTVEAQVRVVLERARGERETVRESSVVSALSSGPLSEPDVVRSLLDAIPSHLAQQLSHAWDLRHVETGAHVRRLAEYTTRLAIELGMAESEAKRLGRVAMLHDIGKIAIPDSILTKPGKLTDEEFALMKRHSEIGGQILSGSNCAFMDLAARVARSHHERWNGKGYPDGLVEEDCIWEARLVGVVDVYDALGQARCYKPGWSRSKIVEYFQAERGESFDPEMTDVLLDTMSELEIVKSEHPDPLPRQTPIEATAG